MEDDETKKLMIKLLNEILERLDGGTQTSWLPGKKYNRKSNGAALALLALILGILLGFIGAAILKGG